MKFSEIKQVGWYWYRLYDGTSWSTVYVGRKYQDPAHPNYNDLEVKMFSQNAIGIRMYSNSISGEFVGPIEEPK
jgi:hypothetical protein